MILHKNVLPLRLWFLDLICATSQKIFNIPEEVDTMLFSTKNKTSLSPKHSPISREQLLLILPVQVSCHKHDFHFGMHFLPWWRFRLLNGWSPVNDAVSQNCTKFCGWIRGDRSGGFITWSHFMFILFIPSCWWTVTPDAPVGIPSLSAATTTPQW